jgi:phospholipase/carboxylesterase
MVKRGAEDDLLAVLAALVPAVLAALERLAFVRRHAHLDHAALRALAGETEEPLASALRALDAFEWPEHLLAFGGALREVTGATLEAIEHAAAGHVRQAFERGASAVRALYPFAAMLPPVSRFFIEPARRQDERLLGRLAAADLGQENIGVLRAGNASSLRGDWAVYVPEYYGGDARWPLIVGLHGGGGSGSDFLWSWLREARTRGMILACPTSAQDSWPLWEPEAEARDIAALVEWVSREWQVDSNRILLTGMSDGGTYVYLCGLQTQSPFTHLAPIAATFHPLLLDGLDVSDRPVYIVHGVHDHVFPVDTGRLAAAALEAAGARVTYRELDDLAHTYPTEENAAILDWFMREPPGRPQDAALS